MKGVALFLADGFEDMEALATLDVLRRGGVDVSTVSIASGRSVTSSHGVTVVADRIFGAWLADADVDGTSRSDLMIFPGGMPGSRHLAEHEALMNLMKRHYDDGGSVAAICAAPGLVLSQLSDVRGLHFTCFDGFEDAMQERGAVYVPEGIVQDGRVITGRGAGWAVPFGLALVSFLKGEVTAVSVRAGLMIG